MEAGQQLTTRILGYAGLIPFVVPAFLIASGSEYSDLVTDIAEAYAFGIICFLTGSWWGMALQPGTRSVLILSNLYFLVAFFIYLFAIQWWALAAAILLMSIYFAEQNSSLFPAFPGHYRKMRTALTLIACISMLIVHLAG